MAQMVDFRPEIVQSDTGCNQPWSQSAEFASNVHDGGVEAVGPGSPPAALRQSRYSASVCNRNSAAEARVIVRSPAEVRERVLGGKSPPPRFFCMMRIQNSAENVSQPCVRVLRYCSHGVNAEVLCYVFIVL